MFSPFISLSHPPTLFYLLSFAVPSLSLLALLPRVMGGEIGVTAGICSSALRDETHTSRTRTHTHTITGALNASGAATVCVWYQSFITE